MRRFWIIFITLFLILFATDAIPQLRGGWGWQWTYAGITDTPRLLLLISAVGVYLAGVLWTRRLARGQVVWALIGGVLVTLAVINLRGDPGYLLLTRTVSPVYTGASAAAVRNFGREGAESAVKNWPDRMAELVHTGNIHIALSPPGQPLAHYWLATALEPLDPITQPVDQWLRPQQCHDLEVMRSTPAEMTSAGVGMLMPLWAMLTIFPLFWIGRRLSGDPQAAARLTQWWALIPSLMFFAPSWNTLFPLLVICAFALLLYGLDRRQMVWCVLAGMIMSVATFLNFSVVPALMLMGWYTLGYWYWLSSARWDWPVRVGLWFGVGLLSVWVIFWLYTGYTPLDLIDTAFEQHLGIERNYFIWLILHVYDLFFFAGWALVGLALWGVWRAIHHLRQRQTIGHVEVLALALFLTLLILDVSGSARGETARVWLFFVPFLLLSGLMLFQRGRNWDIPLLIVQGASVIVIASVIAPMETFMIAPPDQPREDMPRFDHLELIPVNATFEDETGHFQLEGYRFIADPSQQAISWELWWRGDVPTARPYQFELVAYGENEVDGQVISEPYRWYPQRGNYLTTCWQSGDLVRDVFVMPLPAILQPLVWTARLQAADERTGTMPRILINDETVEAVELGPVRYP